MFVPQKALNVQHLTAAFCQRGVERKWRCLTEEEAWVGTEMALIDYGVPLAPVTSFK